MPYTSLSLGSLEWFILSVTWSYSAVDMGLNSRVEKQGHRQKGQFLPNLATESNI